MKKQFALNIPSDHPAFKGHFPGTPIVPGVVLLDKVIDALSKESGLTVTEWQISSVKFLSPLTPGETASLEYEHLANGSIKFEVFCPESDNQRQIVIGSLSTKVKA